MLDTIRDENYFNEGPVTYGLKKVLDIPTSILRNFGDKENPGIIGGIFNVVSNIYEVVDRTATEFVTTMTTKPIDEILGHTRKRIENL